MLWQLMLVAAAIGAAYYRWSRRRLYRLAKEIPSGLKEYPLLGHAYMFLGSSEDRMTALEVIGRQTNRQGGVSSLWLAHRFFICVTDPKSVEVVSRLCLEKDDFTIKIMRKITGNGSIFAPVSIWRPRRKIMAPFFGLRNLDKLVTLFNKNSSATAVSMRAEVGRHFSVWKYMTAYTFDTVFGSALGMEINSQKDAEHHRILYAVDELMHLSGTRFLQPWLHPDIIYKRLPIYKQFQNHMQAIYDLANKILKRKRSEHASVEPFDKEFTHSWTNYIDILLRSEIDGKPVTDIDIYEELIVMIGAATDTTAASLSFTAVLLSRYPDVQDRVYQELKEVFGDSDREVEPEDLSKLHYLEAVIKESLRLYPSAPIVMREVGKDVVLPSGTTLVEGTSIMIHIWGTNRNPEYWGEDAELFRPERFLEPLRHAAMFIPFSYSVRGCVGLAYGMKSMKTLLANLLRNYKLLPPANMASEDLKKPLEVTYHVTIKAVDDFILRIEDRKKIV